MDDDEGLTAVISAQTGTMGSSLAGHTVTIFADDRDSVLQVGSESSSFIPVELTPAEQLSQTLLATLTTVPELQSLSIEKLSTICDTAATDALRVSNQINQLREREKGVLSADEERLLRNRQNIEAIKSYRNRTATSLKEAKDFIDLQRVNLGLL